MANLIVPGDPIQSYNSETEETEVIPVTVVVVCGHGWTDPQIAQFKAGTVKVGCPDCIAGLAETP